MATTRIKEQLQRSGLALPPGGRRSRWCSWFRDGLTRHRAFRVGVFAAGLVLLSLGAVLWLVSALLSAPLAFAGLWVWSREFHWGHRLLRGFLRRLRSLWSRAKARPLRWAALTLGGVVVAWAAYWAWGRYGPW